ncbi:hypothetical protein I4U23_031464 [Adineta vaga]|nr:hypothetical protein I4U23_031464 [Adineta vaga]
MNIKYLLFFVILQICIVYGSHFRGGTITWRPLNATASGSSADFVIRERFSWRRSYNYPASGIICFCDDTTIATSGTIGENDLVRCTAGSYCPSWSLMNTTTFCTDYSTTLDVSSGERTRVYTLPLNISFTIYYYSGNWLNDLVKGGNTAWFVSNRVNTNLRPDGYINTSPVAVTLPIIYKEINIEHVHVIQMSDFDSDDILQCRWANANVSYNTNQLDECGGICEGVPGARLIQENCTIVFTLTIAGLYAGVALQIEDFYNSAALIANTPMSSVPLQFLFYGYPTPIVCKTPPTIIGNRPNRACIGTPIGSNVTEYVIVETYCPGQTIDNFITSSPIGMEKSAILNPSPGIYHLILSWIPISAQYGPEPFCAGAIDNNNLQSNQWCVTFLVGFDSPDVIRPKVVQGSISPIGTIFQNHTLFSFQTTKSVGRPTRNGTNIYFRDATNNGTIVAQFDCGWAPEVTFTGFTTVIRFNNTPPWQPGHFYYVTMAGGVVSGTEFCGPESAPINDPTYWVFNIWNPALSSTTTTTTTPFTTNTITTRPTSTTSINTLLTTTGIVITTAAPATTTTSTTAPPTTTTSTTTTGSTGSIITTETTAAVMYSKDFEEACKYPILIMTTVIFAIAFPIQTVVMYLAFIKFEKMYNPSRINAKARHQQRMKRIMRA